MADIVLDTKGMKCPLPIVQIAKAVKKMGPGQTLEIIADDLAFPEDVKAWCNMTGNVLDNLTNTDGVLTAKITMK